MPSARKRLRQDATSCELCRTRKLKCDRQRPTCANCHTRRISCVYRLKSSDDGRLARSATSSYESSQQAQQSDAPSLNLDIVAESRALAARLQRLEEFVCARGQTLEAGPDQHRGSLPSLVTTTTPLDNAANADSMWLEMVERTSDEMTNTLNINIGTLEQSLSTEVSLCPPRRIVLPPYQVVMACLDAYTEYLDGIQHIMHAEDTRCLIDRVYSQAQLHPRQEIDPGAIALVLSMCATVAFHWIAGFRGAAALFEDHTMALNASTGWAMQSLSAIEQVRVGSSVTLQAIQASAILMFLFYHVEGLTYRVRMMLATSIAMARDLELHRVDSPEVLLEALSHTSIVEIEVKRRIWWYLTSTDWHLSIVGGPLEGIYTIRPQQMSVRLPRNIDRNDLDSSDPDFERSFDEPTAMSYYLQRVKLSITCREIADALYDFSAPQAPDYEIVKFLDSKFQRQLEELPRFLRFDLSHRQLKTEFGPKYTHQTNIQGMMINVMIHIRRCKLHLPYLIRARAHANFAFSRLAGLQAARSVFNVRRIMLSDGESASAAHLRLGGMLRHIFFATVILVMDLCVNQQQHKDTRSLVAEVREALDILEQGKQASPVGSLFLDSLMTVLRKHHVRLSTVDQTRNTDHRDAAPSDSAMAVSMSDAEVERSDSNHPGNIYTQNDAAEMLPGSTSGTGDAHIMPDDELWQDFIEQGPMLRGEEWSALINDLDMHLA